MTRTFVLTSRENFVWHSMQEILPSIESSWMESSRGPQSEIPHEVRLIDVDGHRASDRLAEMLAADNIVLTCFNAKISREATILRARLGLDARFFIHLHNQATIACWPFHAWGLAEHLRSDDVFVSSCSLDRESMRHSFENCRTELVPFTFQEPPLVASGVAATISSDFVYVGRLSAQKNLHALLYAYSLLLEARPGLDGRLIFYGGEDHLGSPNMGARAGTYGAELRALTKRLGLEARVEFKGFRERQNLHRELDSGDHIFISPSLHSDENFGMAAFRELSLGRRAVLSRWGGHADFVSSFPEQVFPVDVRGGGFGPWLDPQDLAAAMARALGAAPKSPHLPSIYRREAIAERLAALATEPLSPGERLRPTELAKRIVAKRAAFVSAGADPCRIFSSYADADAEAFFAGYGMSPVPSLAPGGRPLRLHPWGRIANDAIELRDPHRGSRSFARDRSGLCTVTDFDGRSAQVGAETASLLLTEGWACRASEGAPASKRATAPVP